MTQPNILHTLPVLTVEPPPSEQRYNHRNGETEPPTIDGYFGYRGKNPLFTRIVHVVTVEGKIQEAHFDYGFTHLPVGQWWGPISGPWQDESQRWTP